MRGGNKSLNLYKELSGNIKSGHLLCGDKFPAENEMAIRYGVSCGTIRKALQMLQNDGVIERTRKKGTFVIESRPPPSITILLPCPDYLSYRSFSTGSLLEIMEGAMRTAAEHNVRIETVPAGIDTDPKNINWKNLDFITSESRIIIYGLWYSNIFPFLRERRCRVALCHNQARPELRRGLESSGWHTFTVNTHLAAVSGVTHLLRRNCRRIACHCVHFHEEGHPFAGGYLAALEKYGLAINPALIFSDIRQAGRLQRQFAFDGLLVDDLSFSQKDYEDFHRAVGISPQTLIVFRHDRGYTPHPAFSAMKFDFIRIGKEMASALLSPGGANWNPVYKPELITALAEPQSRTPNRTVEIYHHLNT